MEAKEFQELVWEKGHELYRDMPWRDEPTLYNVLVSELMLQQTQVSRVLVKFAEFMQAFPTMDALAAASLADVLRVWTGLGYNRRAKFLHESAREIIRSGAPQTREALVKLPGIGANTAAAIMNYVYESPTPYVETNIRTVYFQHFFADHVAVSDKELLEIVARTMDREHPREWFWALMDYGTSLKAKGLGRLNTSKHYKKQSALKGSVREVRGQIIRTLGDRRLTNDELRRAVEADDRYERALSGLVSDGLVSKIDGALHLTK